MQRIPVEITCALQEIARRNHTTVESVRNEIEAAIQIGISDRTPEVQERWKKIPCEHDIPTPEELILCLSRQLS